MNIKEYHRTYGFRLRYLINLENVMPQRKGKHYILDNQKYQRVGYSSEPPYREEVPDTRPAKCLATPNSE